MKQTLMQAIVTTAVATAPILAFAQAPNAAPVTRAQVKNEIVQLEKSGYSLTGSNIDYPSTLQAAQARADAATSTATATTTYGGKLGGTTDAGSPAPTSPKSLYLDNGGSLYVGD